MNWAQATASGDDRNLSFGIWCALYNRFYGKSWANDIHEIWVEYKFQGDILHCNRPLIETSISGSKGDDIVNSLAPGIF